MKDLLPVNGFFTDSLSHRDPELYASIADELGRQRDEIELIASENITSPAVLRGAGLGLDQQVRRRLPGQALLRRLRVRRHRRKARHRARLQTLRLRVRQRPATRRGAG
jgi:hypothetical protein